MTRDTEDARAYNFGPTDRCVERIREYGAKFIFRLGESRDSFDFKPYLNPTRYIDKIADICLHIVMHYNAGFADGYKWNITNFEIWSGADTARGFSGTVEDYIALYKRCALLIREKFPRVKLGGYTSLGFSGMNRVTDDPELKGASDFMEKFLYAVSPRGENLPFDFLTWRAAVTSPEELALHSKYARSMLKGYGVRAKSIVSEFMVTPKDREPTAADYLAAMISAEKSEIDAMLYYAGENNEAKEIADIAYTALYECGSGSCTARFVCSAGCCGSDVRGGLCAEWRGADVADSLALGGGGSDGCCDLCRWSVVAALGGYARDGAYRARSAWTKQ